MFITIYIQLREFAQKLSGTESQFNVYWDSNAAQAVIQPGVPYTGEAPVDNTSVDANTSSEEDGVKLKLNTKTGNNNQKFRFIKIDGDICVIQCVHSGKWWNSSGKKGAVLTQSVTVTDGRAITFSIMKQADGTYKIMDSTGLYVDVSDGKMENGANIILGTEDESLTFIFDRIE